METPCIFAKKRSKLSDKISLVRQLGPPCRTIRTTLSGGRSKKDFKFIGKVESKTNNWRRKKSVLAYFTWFFSSKTNRFPNLYAKLLRKKTLNLNLGSCSFFYQWSLQNREFSSTLGETLLKRCNLKTLRSKISFYLLCAYFWEKILNWYQMHFLRISGPNSPTVPILRLTLNVTNSCKSIQNNAHLPIYIYYTNTHSNIFSSHASDKFHYKI